MVGDGDDGENPQVMLIQGNDLRGMDLRKQKVTIGDGRSCGFRRSENTERDYSQRKYVKNAVVVSDGDDGENPPDSRGRRVNFEEWI